MKVIGTAMAQYTLTLLAHVRGGISRRVKRLTRNFLPLTSAINQGPVRLLSLARIAGRVPDPSFDMLPGDYTDKFVVRQDLQQALSTSVGQVGSTTVKVVVLMGMGGSGKTQLALDFCMQPATKTMFEAIFWMDATSPDTLNRSFDTTAAELAKQSKETVESGKSFAFVKEKLQNRRGNWLLVFDNLNDLSAFTTPTNPAPVNLRSYFPRGGNGAIVIITRDRLCEELVTSSRDCIEVGSMTQSQGLDLFFGNSRFQRDHSTIGDATRILEALGYLAFSIAQAAAYIACSHRDPQSLQRYLHLFNTRRQHILTSIPPQAWTDFKSLHGMQNAIDNSDEAKLQSAITILELSFEQLDVDSELGTSNAHILNLCSYLDNEDISENVFRAHLEKQTARMAWMNQIFGGSQWDSNLFHGNGTKRLIELFLLHRFKPKLEMDAGPGTGSAAGDPARNLAINFSLHPLIRDWVMLRADSGTRKTFLTETIEMLFKFINLLSLNNVASSEITSALAHLDTCVQNDAKYLAPDGLCSSSESLMNAAGMRFAEFYRDNGRYADAEGLYQRAVTGSHAIGGGGNGQDSVETLFALEALGLVYRLQGRLSEAERTLREAQQRSDQLLGPDHIDSLVTAGHLATVFKNQGRYEVARESLERIRAAFERSPEPRDTVVIKRKFDNAQVLGNVYKHLGQLSRAEPLLLEAYEGYRNLQGSRDRETLSAAVNLAAFYVMQRKLQAAEDLYMETLRGHEEVFGENHPQTIQVMNSKATVCLILGQEKEAEEQFNEALRRAVQTGLPSNHFLRTKILQGLAECHSHRGNYLEAERLLRQVVENNRSLLGPDHPDTVVAVNFLREVRLLQQQKSTTRAPQQVRTDELEAVEAEIAEGVQDFFQEMIAAQGAVPEEFRQRNSPRMDASRARLPPNVRSNPALPVDGDIDAAAIADMEREISQNVAGEIISMFTPVILTILFWPVFAFVLHWFPYWLLWIICTGCQYWFSLDERMVFHYPGTCLFVYGV